jgi:hypothetical protein
MLAELIDRIRRNHGLEHATIHMLSEKHRNFSAQGNSDPWGFRLNIYGDISEESVYDAVEEAYKRLRAGEHSLAVHPNCGTVLLTTATMATIAAQATFGLERLRQRRTNEQGSSMLSALPSAILAVVGALIISRPLGVSIQAKYTTKGDLGNLEISRIRPVPASLITKLFQLLLSPGRPNLMARAYRVETRG